jgi:heavy metal efflux system protein
MFVGPLLLLVVAPALRRIFLSGDAEHHVIAGAPVAVTEGNSDG